jgi:N-acetylneuraminate synthase
MININNTQIGYNTPPYFIADIGANHDGSIERAYDLICLAKESGANAAKFQNFTAEKIVSDFGFKNLKVKSHQSNWNKSVFDVYKDASISQEWTLLLKKKCDEVGIDYFSSPYDFDSVDHLDAFVCLYKIGSGEITWIDLIKYIAKKNKPVLLATGASSLDDVSRAVNSIMDINPQIVLMQCNTNYEVDINKYKYVNLNVLNLYKKLYPNLVLGLSDHTFGFTTVIGAIALGARVIEKHFTDDNNRKGPDHSFAMNPSSWKDMVKYGNEVFYSLGDGIKRIEQNEIDSKIVQQRCIRVNRNMSKGEIIHLSDLEFLRPCPSNAISPYLVDTIIAKKLLKSIDKGSHLTYNDFI